MHFRNIIVIASLASGGFSSYVPKPSSACPAYSPCPTPTPTSAAPPPGQTYVTKWPACNVTGYTEVPGSYVETTYKQINATLIECIGACRKTVGCESIAFVPRYTLCLFYDRLVRGIQLWPADNGFIHYDLNCPVYA